MDHRRPPQSHHHRSGPAARRNYQHSTPYDRPSGNSAPRFQRTARSLEETLKGDSLIYPDQLNSISDLGDLDYAGYRLKHRQAILERFFLAHKDDCWFKEWYSNTETENKVVDEVCSDIKLEDGEDLSIAASEETGVKMVPSAMLPSRLQDSFNARQLTHSLAISNIPPSLSRTRLQDGIRGVAERDDFKVILSHPIPDKAFYRTGWVLFPETIDLDLAQLATRLEEHAFEEPGAPTAARLFFSPARSYSLQIRVADPIFSGEERKVKDRELAGRLVEAFGGEAASKELDQLIVYLRRVHHCCYYCGIQCANQYDLWRYCGDVHVRATVSNAEGNAEWLDQRIEDLIALQTPNMAQPNEERLLERHVIRVDEGRYRCQACAKLFKGPEFVIKHLQGKHEDLVQQSLSDLPLLKALLTHPIPPAWPLTPWRLPVVEPTIARRRSRDDGNAPCIPKPSTDPHGRSVRRYVDWDRPPTGEVEISYD